MGSSLDVPSQLSIEAPFVPANSPQTDEERVCDSGIRKALRTEFKNSRFLGGQTTF